MPGTIPINSIRPLCYEHHTEMTLPELAPDDYGLAYACRELDCLVHYTRSRGYFLNTENRDLIEQEVAPHEQCSVDGHPMYLLEVQPQHPSFRLWRCPKCNMSRSAGTLS